VCIAAWVQLDEATSQARDLGAKVARLEEEVASSRAALQEVTHSKAELESTAGEKANRLARIEGASGMLVAVNQGKAVATWGRLGGPARGIAMRVGCGHGGI
jgi:outer membrane murein-binding lipoprotein Lpp